MDARERYDELVDDLCARNDDVSPSQMMGMPCIKRGGKMVAGFASGTGLPNSEQAMVFKLPDPAAHAEALALEGAHLFDPGGEGAAVQGVGRRAVRARGRVGIPGRARAQARWLNQQPASSSRKTHAFRPDSSTRSK